MLSEIQAIKQADELVRRGEIAKAVNIYYHEAAKGKWVFLKELLTKVEEVTKLQRKDFESAFQVICQFRSAIRKDRIYRLAHNESIFNSWDKKNADLILYFNLIVGHVRDHREETDQNEVDKKLARSEKGYGLSLAKSTDDAPKVPGKERLCQETDLMLPYKVAAASYQNSRGKPCEDRIGIENFKCNFKEGETNVYLFAVMDGHVNTVCAEFLFNHFSRILMEALDGKDHKNSLIMWNTLKLITNKANEEFHSHNPESSSGSTLCFVLIIGKILWCVNLGDSRAMICFDDGACQLSRDMDARKLVKRPSIEKRGGDVLWVKDDSTRLDGMMEMTGAIGDYHLSYKEQLFRPPGLGIRPDIMRCDLSKWEGSEHLILILGTDGLFEKSGTRDIASVVRKDWDRLTEREIAENLVGTGFEKGTTDDITALVVNLKVAKSAKTSETTEKQYWIYNV